MSEPAVKMHEKINTSSFTENIQYSRAIHLSSTSYTDWIVFTNPGVLRVCSVELWAVKTHRKISAARFGSI